MAIKLIIPGAAGRMGRTLVRMALEDDMFTLAGATELPGSPVLGEDAGTLAGCAPCGTAVTDALPGDAPAGSVIIDFTAPEATLTNLETAREKGWKMVVGTTGFTDEQLGALTAGADKTAVVRSGNMSIGINLLQSLVENAARTLGAPFDIEIIEAHHRHKKDAPSGTALMLGEAAAEGRALSLDKNGVYGRHGMTGERSRDEIGIHAVRGGAIVGEHTVMFASGGERIELTHRAQSRDIFASGAIRAAAFLSGKETGMFTMRDVLGL